MGQIKEWCFMGVNLPHMSELFLPSNCVLLCNQLLMFCLIRSRWKHEGGSGWQEISHIIFHRPGARGSKHGRPGFRVESQRKEEEDVWAWVSWVCVIFSFTLTMWPSCWDLVVPKAAFQLHVKTFQDKAVSRSISLCCWYSRGMVNGTGQLDWIMGAQILT